MEGVVNFKVELYNETYAIILGDIIFSFTTRYEEIEDIVLEWCEENNLEFGEDVQIWDCF